MENLPGYHLMEKVIDGETWELHKAYSIEEDRIVALKSVKSDIDLPYEIAEVIHDYHITKELPKVGILSPIKLEKYRNRAYIATNLFQGLTMKEWLKNEKTPHLPTFLRMANQLCTILSLVHQERIIHKSLHPNHILYHPKTGEMKLTGFHQATKLPTENELPTVSPYQLKRQLMYMSPEQTGRMNRSLDYRTDIYSLGVIFYELIIGSPPFQIEDPAEIIHAHLAKAPVPPRKLDETIPEIISDIIMKLLEKNPESRYQSVYDLKLDIEKCLTDLNQNGKIDKFQLAKKESKILLEKPSKLYGRKEAIEELLAGFKRVQDGKKEILYIPGLSGIGKTVLVNEIHKPLIQEKGYFISGKFVQLKKQIPYEPLVHAFQGLIRQILTEGTDRIQNWRTTILTELDTYAGVIANFIPEIKWIIGDQGDIPELPPDGVLNRFRQSIKRFIGIFSKREHPLVLFLDDLQWADTATLDLIEYIMRNEDIQHLFVIGAYRVNEIHVGHPLELMQKNIKESGVSVTELSLTPLNDNHIKEWVYETLMIAGDDADYLVDMMFRITKGIPFYIVQVFQSLYDESILSFDTTMGKWKVNSLSLKKIPVQDTILDFMLKRIEKLLPQTKQILQLASCFGNQFDLKSLATIAEKSFFDTAELLWEGLKEGLILPLDQSYKWIYPNENMDLIQSQPPRYLFLHDRVLQVFYMTMTEETREVNHLRIGQQLQKHYAGEQLEEHIFEIVNHLNRARNRLNEEEKLDLSKWNGTSGERAMKSAATEAALSFFLVAKELLPPFSWNNHYETTFRIMMGLGESQYLNRLFDESEETFNLILDHARSTQDKLTVYQVKITLYTHIHEVKKAVQTGLDGIRLFGLRVNPEPSRFAVAKEYLLTKFALGKKNPKDLLLLPSITDSDRRQLMKVIINTIAPVYLVNQNLATILMLRTLRLMLKYGDMDISAIIYINYALTLSAGFKDYHGSYQFGKLAIEHSEKHGDNGLRGHVYFVIGTFVNHWKHHLRINLNYLVRSQQLSIESGNLHLAGAGSAFIGIIMFMKGDPLSEVSAGIEQQLKFAKDNEYSISDDALSEFQKWIENLTNEDSFISWDFPTLLDDASIAIVHTTFRLQMTYLFQNERVARSIINTVGPLVESTLELIVVPDFYFYHSLWLIRWIREGQHVSKKDKKRLKKMMVKLKQWAEHSPENYQHKFLLVKAEWEQDKRNELEVMQLYNLAIKYAEENDYIQDAAIANQCAGEYYLFQKLPKSAKAYLTDAYVNFQKWGANKLANDLLQTYPDLIQVSIPSLIAASTENKELDLHAIFETAGIISSEIILKHLLRKLMHVVLTYSGAEHAYLLLNNENELEVVAVNHSNRGIEVYEQPESTATQSNLSLAIVDYVVNSSESVVLMDALNEGHFRKDAYIKKNHTKSVLCMPLLNQGTLTGVLYLENNQSTYAFSEEKIDLLSFIASQAAVSIEKAYLYANLEEKVKQRTEMLHIANQNLTHVNRSLERSEEKRRQMLANISHDLLSPVAVVKGYVEAVLDGFVESPEKEREYLQVVRTRLALLNGLIEDLFVLARLESQDIIFEMDTIPIDKLFLHLCNQFKLEIEQSGLMFQMELPNRNGAYPLVEVDVKRMEQVMGNLVSNAIKHSGEGRIIRIALLLETSKKAIILIEDQGEGISKEELQFIFERAYSNNINPNKKGNGLGLTISKEIVQAHKGIIWAESKVGIGTKFCISLPIFDIQGEY
ncbi:ATP-binding sensor histidine kinase [Paucisalibacillus sp. EB02]|uniref:ATP-binding sensor histidine kinase n=1 Tax=Paucisalibacillus sp. EB02 TaxID=1347087 RepID=UPI0004BCE81C|nr:ATP-binding sensor histidine kinase [Paucisalibacillus sp. EB02]